MILARWEVVARLHVPALADGTPARSWITPASHGRTLCVTRTGARLAAWRTNLVWRYLNRRQRDGIRLTAEPRPYTTRRAS